MSVMHIKLSPIPYASNVGSYTPYNIVYTMNHRTIMKIEIYDQQTFVEFEKESEEMVRFFFFFLGFDMRYL